MSEKNSVRVVVVLLSLVMLLSACATPPSLPSARPSEIARLEAPGRDVVAAAPLASTVVSPTSHSLTVIVQPTSTPLSTHTPMPSLSPTDTPAPVVATEAAPVVATEAAPVVATEAAPVVATEAAPVVATEAAPVGATEAAPVGVTEAAPVVVTEAAPVVATEAAPVVATEAAPVVVTEAAPVVVLTDTPAPIPVEPQPSETPTPIVTPTLACKTDTAFVSLSVSSENLRPGDAFKVKVTLNNAGCVSLGLPQYRLYIQSNSPEPLFTPSNPEAVVHYLGVEPGQSDTVEFDLTAVASGQLTVTASASYEVHLENGAYWGYSPSGELPITIQP